MHCELCNAGWLFFVLFFYVLCLMEEKENKNAEHKHWKSDY